MKKTSLFLFVLFVFLNFIQNTAFASSDYVLPYPSSMPGSLMYKPHKAWEELSRYWYFGNFGQFTYNLKQSDKYLVEAKTLFECRQYLLGYESLQRSNEYFKKTLPFLEAAKKEKKDIKADVLLLSLASIKHIETIEKIEKEVPESFDWQPEKSSSSFLNLRSLINESISIRKKYQ